jgi:hypothetical protein
MHPSGGAEERLGRRRDERNASIPNDTRFATHALLPPLGGSGDQWFQPMMKLTHA